MAQTPAHAPPAQFGNASLGRNVTTRAMPWRSHCPRGLAQDRAECCALRWCAPHCCRYAQSHIYLAFEIAFYLIVFQNVTAIVDFWQICLMVWAAYLAAGALALSPWVFNPQALTFPALAAGTQQWVRWMNDLGDFKMAGGGYTKWHAARLELVREQASLTS